MLCKLLLKDGHGICRIRDQYYYILEMPSEYSASLFFDEQES